MSKNNLAVAQKPGIREQQRLQTRKLILQASLDLFSERGFDGAVLRDIAAEAGVNHAMVKYHFENKENLWREAVTFLFERCNEELYVDESRLAGKTRLERVKFFIHNYIHYCARHPEHARIMVQASIRDNDRLSWAVEEFISKQHNALMQFMENSSDEQIWPQNCSPVSLMYITVSACQNIFMLAPEVKKTHGINMKSKTTIDEYADTLLTLFFDHKAE